MMKKMQECNETEMNNKTLPTQPTIGPIRFTPKFVPKPSPLIPSPVFNHPASTPSLLASKVPPPPGFEEPKPSPFNNHVQNEEPVETSNNNQTNSKDYFANVNRARSTMDMNDWPPSLM